jgi:hypothetical protein
VAQSWFSTKLFTVPNQNLPKMSDECPRYIFRQDTQLCGG